MMLGLAKFAREDEIARARRLLYGADENHESHSDSHDDETRPFTSSLQAADISTATLKSGLKKAAFLSVLVVVPVILSGKFILAPLAALPFIYQYISLN